MMELTGDVICRTTIITLSSAIKKATTEATPLKSTMVWVFSGR